MRRLSKRWESTRAVSGGGLYRAFLNEVRLDGSGYSWAYIESNFKGPFRLEIWNMQEGEWDPAQTFPTLKQAKEVGRLLAGVALAKNI